MAATRTAEVTWNGSLAEGKGTIDYVTSGAFTRLPVTWASRTEAADGRTSPEELVASAHASCYAMAFSGGLGRNGIGFALDIAGSRCSSVRFPKAS